MKVKFISGHTEIGGSTIAIINLINLFNEKGIDACLYGESTYPNSRCEYRHIKYLNLLPNDILIYHFYPVLIRPNIKKLILSCHETVWFKIKENKAVYDTVHFVSQFQKDWQGVDGVVIPNVISKLNFKKRDLNKKAYTAGVIGSIDKNKRTHLSIQRALDAGCMEIKLFGRITDIPYFIEEVENYIKLGKAKYCGPAYNKQEMYDSLDIVFHSPELETFNMIKPECVAAGVPYVGNEGNDTKAEIWDNDRIFEAWQNLLK